MQGPVILKVQNLVKYFPIYSRGVLFKKVVGQIRAVDNVSFDIHRGEILGLVGESGCGKTTIAKCILYAEQPTSGEIYFNGINLGRVFASGSKEEKMKLRRKMQLIFQNPYTSLDPRMTVFDILSEPFRIHKHIPREKWEDRVYELLRIVGLEDYHAERYPHEFSGGQRQRICIARALSVEPELILADEPVSSLDLSIRAQILNLLVELQRNKGLSYLYISHDLSSVRQICHRVATMYLGKIIELADADDLFSNPLNPYTQALLTAIPVPDPDKKRSRIILPGEVPSPINPPKGCRFHPRCPYSKDICRSKEPTLTEATKGHYVACHLMREFV